MFMKNLFVLIVIFSFSSVLSSQQIANVSAVQQDSKISVYYDITGAAPNQLFNIKLYCSTDGGNSWGQPLRSVSQDVGTGIAAGYNKKVVWDVLSEVNELKGDNVKFEIRATFQSKIADSQSGMFVDNRDNQQYKYIKVGDQTWMAQNLNYQTSAGSWCYDNSSTNCSNFGRLYSFNAAMNVCPLGWHLPSDLEWKNFENIMQGNDVNLDIGDLITITGKSVNPQSINKFNVVLGGWRSYKGSYYRLGFSTNFWTSSSENKTYAWSRKIDNSTQRIFRDSYDKESGFSVRCIKD
jgi:uncharacterized protein (TIGR02145 family)